VKFGNAWKELAEALDKAITEVKASGGIVYTPEEWLARSSK